MNFPKRIQKIFPVQLSKKEAQIQHILLQVVDDLEQKTNLKIQLRIAGGWVRDKVLDSYIVNGNGFE
jgi:hypothetical protein